MTNDKPSRSRKPTTPSSRAQNDEAQVSGITNVESGDSNLVKEMLIGNSSELGITTQNPIVEREYYV